jgi:Family of unknown function (DUF6807)
MHTQISNRWVHSLLAALVTAFVCNGIAIAAAPVVSFDTSTPGKMPILVDGQQIAVYEYNGEDIPRPYFAHVKAPSGQQVTRHHPPIAGQDPTDHAALHPGIWMSFGDLSGNDYWRNQAKVRTEVLGTPKGGAGEGSFTVRNRYFGQQHPEDVACEELCRIRILVKPDGYLFVWDSTFSADHEMWFGDQEEMGIGFRMATPLREARSTDGGLVAGNGLIRDAKDRQGAQKVWGESADWCDYSGTLDGQQVGITLMCHPENFRPSWFHARDYGLLEANPFGRAAFHKGETSKVTVGSGDRLRLLYGLLIHSNPIDHPIDFDSAYAEYLSAAGK